MNTMNSRSLECLNNHNATTTRPNNASLQSTQVHIRPENQYHAELDEHQSHTQAMLHSDKDELEKSFGVATIAVCGCCFMVVGGAYFLAISAGFAGIAWNSYMWFGTLLFVLLSCLCGCVFTICAYQNVVLISKYIRQSTPHNLHWTEQEQLRHQRAMAAEQDYILTVQALAYLLLIIIFFTTILCWAPLLIGYYILVEGYKDRIDPSYAIHNSSLFRSFQLDPPPEVPNTEPQPSRFASNYTTATRISSNSNNSVPRTVPQVPRPPSPQPLRSAPSSVWNDLFGSAAAARRGDDNDCFIQ